MYLLGMVAEPVIYLVVWSTIAEQSGGDGRRSHGRRLRRLLHRLDARPDDEHRLHARTAGSGGSARGELSAQLLRPLHPIHYDIAEFAGGKLPWVLFYLPIAVGADARLPPDVRHPPGRRSSSSPFAIWGAYLIRTFNQSALGLMCFWTTRVGAVFQLYIVLELLLSGRLVPLTLMPDWVQTLAWFLPFRWTFYFPIETLVGDLSNAELARRARHAGPLDACRHRRSSRSSGATRSGATRRWGTDVTTLRVALLHLRVGVMNDLQYRVNFALQVLQSLLALGDRARRARPRLLAHGRS